MKRITFFAILLCGILGLTSQYTHAETGTLCSYYDGSSDSGSFDELYGGGTSEDVIEDGKPCFKFTNDQAKEYMWDIQIFIAANLKEDYLYTVSFDVKGDPGKIQMGYPLYDSDPINVTSGWSHITLQCKSTENAEYTSFVLGRYIGTLYITNFVITYESPFDPSEPARSIITNGDCSTDNVSCFFSKTGSSDPIPATIDKEAGAYRVDIPENRSGNPWDSQFFIKSNYQLPAGTPITFKMKVKCTDTRHCDIQAHKNNPGDYYYYSYLGGGFTTEANEWTEYSWTGEVQPEADRCDIAALNLSEKNDAATIWFKDIEWIAGAMEEPEEPEVPNDGLLASWLGNWEPLYSSGKGQSYVNYWQVNISNKLIYKVDGIGICDQPDEFKYLYGILSGKRPTPGKTYKLTFDIVGKAPAEGIPVTLGNGIISNEFSTTFDITTEWQRVTLEITPTDEDLYKLDFILDKYDGTFYITNIYLYDALFTPNLPEIPTIDPKTIPTVIKVAMPVAIGESLPIPLFIDAEEWTPLNWRSSDESVAIVADGLVTGVAKGRARISISSINAYASEDLIVEVYEPEAVTVPVSTITIDPMVIDDAKVGDQIRLTANVMPENADDKSVTWSSSKEEVATVDESGLVTIVAPGTAVITATANDGNGAKGVCLISGMSGIEDIVYSSPDEPKDIYTIDGKLIMRRATREDINRLSQGVYLIGNQKIAIR